MKPINVYKKFIFTRLCNNFNKTIFRMLLNLTITCSSTLSSNTKIKLINS